MIFALNDYDSFGKKRPGNLRLAFCSILVKKPDQHSQSKLYEV